MKHSNVKRRIIVCPLIKQENDYLICKMLRHRGAFPNRWGLPGGGMEKDENMIQALKREIKEELGDELILSLFYLGSLEMIYLTNYIPMELLKKYI